MVRKNSPINTAPAKQSQLAATEPLAVTIPEGCRLIGVKRSTVYREIAAGRITALKAGKRTLLPVASLRAWLASLPQSTAA